MASSKKLVILVLMISLLHKLRAEVGETDLNDVSEKQNAVKINKCCEDNEVLLDSKCYLSSSINISVWIPKFSNEDGTIAAIPYYRAINGDPDCKSSQKRAVFNVSGSEDKLVLLSDGRLRHYIFHQHAPESDREEPTIQIGPNQYKITENIQIPDNKEPTFYDYIQGKYCIDKTFMTDKNQTAQYALVCIPEVVINWTDADFLLKKIFNPLFHSIAMILFLLVAIIYFILPTLRDLAGNIITTINVCLIFSQAADLVRVFTEFSNHVSFMIADVILYISLLSAFFWLNSFGFYIWKTFKSRNVFLRVTDIRKYCYYSCVVWGCTTVMAVLAICAHFLLDTGTDPNRVMKNRFSSSIIANMDQETIGWLGIAIFFTPVAFTILFNIFFLVTTTRVIKRINTYGRIHYKLKGSFNLFIQLFIIMTTAWLFLLLSWLQFDGLVYAHIVVNLLQAVLIFYVCIVRQNHVTFLLRKSCCYAEPVPTADWGDEMTHMNGHYGSNY